jgi:hypothetical protein
MRKSAGKGGIKGGFGNFLWKISVALYLIANGVLAITTKGGDFKVIFERMFSNNFVDTFVIIAGIIAVVSGIAVICELFEVKVSFRDTLIFIAAIIWSVFIIFQLIGWLSSDQNINFWFALQQLSIYLMVSGSLFIASRRFG